MGRLTGVVILIGMFCCPAVVLSATTGQSSAAPSSATTAATDWSKTDFRQVSRLFNRLKAIRVALLRDGRGQRWGNEGHVRILEYAPARWEQAHRRVKAYRRGVDELVMIPVGTFLTRPRAFMQVADVIQWGQQVAIGRPRFIRPGYFEVIPVLEPPAKSAASSTPTTTAVRQVPPRK